MSRVEDSSAGNLIRVRSRWDYARRKLKRRGVVEVNKSHPHHDMLCAVQMGIRSLLTDHPESKAKEDLTSEDYTQKIKFDVKSPSGKTYTFGSYASPVFACVRSAVDISEADFLESLSPQQLPYLEFISNSRSGQDFYFSNNQRFVLKTDKPHCIEYFLSIIQDYLGHFLTYPHSLLVKFLGLFSITSAGARKKYFLVMQSIFYPTVRMDERYDLKGCLANRYQDPNPSGKKTILVLKDQNFLEGKIELGAQKDWFLAQLKADVDFLLSIGVQDYSLLLGRHPLHVTEKRESVGNLIVRMRKSFGNDKKSMPNLDNLEESEVSVTNVQSEVIQEDSPWRPPPSNADIVSGTEVPDISPDIASGTEVPNISSTNQSESPNRKTNIDSKKRNVTFLRSFSNKVYLDSTGLQFQNRRLLLNCDNNLHIIDGSEYRYYVGVIDFFTLFRCRQHVSKLLKDVKTCCGNHSTEPPDVYARRFYEFILERVV